MTRKRVIKLLMARGFSRDEAIQKTDLSKSQYKSYSELYKSMEVLIELKALDTAIHKLGMVFKKAAMVFSDLSKQCMNKVSVAETAFEPDER